MSFDIRLPIGLLFLILGALLAGFGLVSGPETYARALGVDLDLDWGLVLFAFGAAMTLLAVAASRGGRT